jgi:cyclophilin family peptidyl-prolyl cis-trans isomerase
MERGEVNSVQSLCKVSDNRAKVLAQRTLLVRTMMTLFAIVVVAISVITSDGERREVRIPKTTPSAASNQVRKRRLVEIRSPRNLPTAVRGSIRNTVVRDGIGIAQKARQQRDAMNRLVEQFGDGPYLVEFETRTWSDDDDTATKVSTPLVRFFTIEMAPSHMMPITVHLFLQQVSNRLWDNTSFYLNAEHLFAAHPVSPNGMISKRSLFTTTNLETLPFPEYNNAYPHLPYTLGLVGNGPEFYINKLFNQHLDPCFAQVVIGRSTVDALFQMRGHDRTPSRIRPVEIVKARIIQRSKLLPNALNEYLRTSISPQ